jgi:hypothetical protein
VPDGLILSTCENSGAGNSTSTGSGATSGAAGADGNGSSSAVAGEREQQGQASRSSVDALVSSAARDEVRLLMCLCAGFRACCTSGTPLQPLNPKPACCTSGTPLRRCA